MDPLALSAPQQEIINSCYPINLFLSGQGGGKTFTAGLVAERFVRKFPKQDGFIAANTYMQLTDSTLKGILKAWEMSGLHRFDPSSGEGDYVIDVKPPSGWNTDGHRFRNYKNKICFRWGTVIYIGSLENYKAHDGKEFAWALLDETKDTREEAIKEVILGRLRQKGIYVSKAGNFVKNKTKEGKAINPLYVFTSPAKVDWINAWFDLESHYDAVIRQIFDKEKFYKGVSGQKFFVIASTFHNSGNLPENFIQNLQENLPSALQEMLIYASPFSKAGGEFYKFFDRATHVGEIKQRYDPAKPLHIAWDFNVAPYVTLTVWQQQENQLLQLREICLASPQNNISAVCRTFAAAFSKHESALFVYGDPSGNQRNIFHQGTHYDLIIAELEAFKPSLRLFKQAPQLIQRGFFINALFQEEVKDAPKLLIDLSCKETIADYQYLKETAEGGKLKEKAKDPESGTSYEKYGHTSDANDYFLCYYLKHHFDSMFGKGKGSYRVGRVKERKTTF